MSLLDLSIEVSPAKTQQVGEVMAILNQAVRYKLEHGDHAWAPEFSEQEVKDLLDMGHTYVVSLEGAIVGTVALEWEDVAYWGDKEDGEAGYFHKLAVGDDWRGHQIGRRIIDWACHQARLKGRRYLRCDCHSDNKDLCLYYEKLGFKKVGTHPFPERGYTATLFERSL